MKEPKKPESGPQLRRNENNILDQEHAAQVTAELKEKLIREAAYVDKQKSFHMARTGKRDIVVMMGVYIRNSVDGHMVLGDDEARGFERFGADDPFKYKTMDTVTVEFPARNLPGRKEFIGKGLMSGFNVLCKWLMSIGAIRG